MGNSTAKKLPPPPAEQIVISQTQVSDHLFIDLGYGRLLQWSIRQKKAIKYYGKIMGNDITAFKTTANKKNLFIADIVGS